MSEKKASKRDVVDSLNEQLTLRGADADFYRDMVRDYGSLWDIKNKLVADIRKRGINYKDLSATGVMMTKTNPSVKELMLVNRQMLSILKELGLSTKDVGDGGDDDL